LKSNNKKFAEIVLENIWYLSRKDFIFFAKIKLCFIDFSINLESLSDSTAAN
jgi:hypothetical protein